MERKNFSNNNATRKKINWLNLLSLVFSIGTAVVEIIKKSGNNIIEYNDRVNSSN